MPQSKGRFGMRKTGPSEADRCRQAGKHSSAKVSVRGACEILPLAIEARLLRDRLQARRERHRRGDQKTPQGPAEQRSFPALRSLCPSPCQGSGTMRPGRSCTRRSLRPPPPARGVLAAPCGATAVQRAPRSWRPLDPCPDARLCLCRKSRIRCRKWRRGRSCRAWPRRS